MSKKKYNNPIDMVFITEDKDHIEKKEEKRQTVNKGSKIEKKDLTKGFYFRTTFEIQRDLRLYLYQTGGTITEFMNSVILEKLETVKKGKK